jgi:hypothetical protein
MKPGMLNRPGIRLHFEVSGLKLGFGTMNTLRDEQDIRDSRVRDIRSSLNHLYRENGRDRRSTSR